ncbi:cytochrome c peroxidase [Tamlana sp. 2201CG12-4]|uniref:cytochrome-c peroxidase n=1 Tax=Tamlana sp. 2201CG12-4 TaxID=3112582 RepID=UPI002DBAA1D0|nr:cytochrome c peroxidase [Tamlana sp. 2201CG12-4]MEC3907890.1 cytochrome c peroxidase [Tamlana sp. 2201CG12-4]
MNFFKTIWVIFILLGQSLQVFSQSNLKEDTHKLREILKPYFVPIEKDDEFLSIEKEKIDLGRRLFYDKTLSAQANISCNSCHDLKKYGTNGQYYQELKKKTFYRDVPSIYNVATLPMYNADGGMTTLKEKLGHSVLSPYEMGMPGKSEMVDRLKKKIDYQILFEKAFPNESDPISFNNMINALYFFIQGLVTPAPVDKFIKGDDNAFTKEQIEGGLVFNSKSCYTCHTGSNIGGQMLQKLGITEEWHNQKDLGYYDVAKQSVYKMFFRVAPLRNVEYTAPYFHDASSGKLNTAIKTMGRYELGTTLSEQETLKIEQFLIALSGDIPYDYIKN